MQRSDFDYNLPQHLIASEPLAERSSSRLMMVNFQDPGQLVQGQFEQVVDLMTANDCLILNNTKVMPARLKARKKTGGKLEILIERVLTPCKVLAHIKSNKALSVDQTVYLETGDELIITGRLNGLFELALTAGDFYQLMQTSGEIPLPHYMKRQPTEHDSQRYQTVYAERLGAVAAPTAGLHFDQNLLTTIQEKGINLGFITLHVGAGTFQPVRVDNIHDHKMHSEWLELSPQVCQMITDTRQRKGRVFAVGTTTLRALEAVAQHGLQPYQGHTDIFIYPGFQFQVVDVLITNFHLPQSTLLMLVSAFGGMKTMRRAYQLAIEQQYRFFSYGDAMIINRDVADDLSF